MALASVVCVQPGQLTRIFSKWGDKYRDQEDASFSVVYAGGEKSLDLICSSRTERDMWMKGLQQAVARECCICRTCCARTA